MTPPRPRIGAVVLHYGTDDLTMRCLARLLDDDVSPPTRVVLVDNGPGAGIAERVRRELPDVEVIVPGENLGFAAGANRGIRALDTELIALVNSDVIVEPGWLTPLVEALDADPARASASPKMLFEGRFHELRIIAGSAWRPGRGDPRELAWRLDEVEVGAVDRTTACRLVDGFWEPEDEGTWAGPTAVLLVPSGAEGEVVRLRIATPPDADVELQLEGAEPARVVIPARGGWCEITPATEATRIVNNVGNSWRADGYGVDLGFAEVDRGQHDAATAVPAWCGGAVLLRRSYLDAVGLFDERLFLYYEDLELSRRGSETGWTYWFEPRSVVSHRHAATAGRDAGRSELLKERNRLLVLLRHDGAGAFVRALLRQVAVTLSYARRDVLSPVLRGSKPRWSSARTRSRAVAGALRLTPGMWRSRRSDRRDRLGMRPLV